MVSFVHLVPLVGREEGVELCRRRPLVRLDPLRERPQLVVGERVLKVAKVLDDLLLPLERVALALEPTNIVLENWSDDV